jgi:hypothetical protein
MSPPVADATRAAIEANRNDMVARTGASERHAAPLLAQDRSALRELTVGRRREFWRDLRGSDGGRRLGRGLRGLDGRRRSRRRLA